MEIQEGLSKEIRFEENAARSVPPSSQRQLTSNSEKIGLRNIGVDGEIREGTLPMLSSGSQSDENNQTNFLNGQIRVDAASQAADSAKEKPYKLRHSFQPTRNVNQHTNNRSADAENANPQAAVKVKQNNERKAAQHILDTSAPDEDYASGFHFIPATEATCKQTVSASMTMNSSIEPVQASHQTKRYLQSLRNLLDRRKKEVSASGQLVDIAASADDVADSSSRKQVKNALHAIKRGVAAVTHKLNQTISRQPNGAAGCTSADKLHSASDIFVTNASKSASTAHIKHELCNHEYRISTYPLIGACVVAFPYAMKAAGFPLGILLLISVAVVMDYSQVLLQHCSVMAKKNSLQEIMKSVFFKPGWILSLLLPTTYSLSVLVTYNVIIGDCLSKVVNSIFRAAGSKMIIHRRVVITMVTLVIVVPVSLISDIKRAARWSLLSLLSATLVTVFVCVKLFTGEHVIIPTHNAFRFLNTNLLGAVAILTFALSGQHKFRLSFAALTQPAATKSINAPPSSEHRANVVTSYSLLCTLTLAICGYLTFKCVTQGDILENYCEEDAFATVCRTFFAVFLICLFPLECHSVRYLFHDFIGTNRKVDFLYHIGATVLVVGPAYLVSLAVDCLSIVLEIAGCLCAIPLVFILPAACYLQLSPGPRCTLKKLPCFLCITIGFVCTVCGVVTVLFTSHQCVHNTRLFPYCNGSSELLGPLITLMSLNGTWEYDPEMLGFNATDLDFTFDNVTDIAAAYFN